MRGGVPVDCIYEGERKLYINPVECIDCGAYEPVCPVEAIAPARTALAKEREFVDDNAWFFTEPLPGRAEPLGNSGGASKFGPVGVDTPPVAEWARSGAA